MNKNKDRKKREGEKDEKRVGIKGEELKISGKCEKRKALGETKD